MKAAFGWTLLSREALKRAETQLRGDLQGVRDEIGFLGLHQLYADRFFPGTSVLHTRLRYVLFVPWLYQKLRAVRGRRSVVAALAGEELQLVKRLSGSKQSGIIGIRSLPNLTSQPPSMVYWTALGAWRILRQLPDARWPDRSAVHRSIARTSPVGRLNDDDHHALEEAEHPFTTIPDPPPGWEDPRVPLDFSLPRHEAAFLRMQLLAVNRAGADGKRSLLAQLVDARLDEATELWDAKVIEVAEAEDRLPLRRAQQAAALSAIGRGVYAALVEALLDRDTGGRTLNLHRRNLREVITEYGDAGLALDVDLVSGDAPSGVNDSILRVLKETQLWLRRPKAAPEDLHRVYEKAERDRKGRRARLTDSLAGREKRAEWCPDEHPPASPLHYRWENVRRLLLDLQGAA